MMNFWTLIILVFILLVLFVVVMVVRKKRRRSSGAKQLYIGNLSYQVHETELNKFFSQFGSVEKVRIVKNKRTHRSKGFGFVTFASNREALNALSAQGQHLKGRALIVRVAKPPKEN